MTPRFQSLSVVLCTVVMAVMAVGCADRCKDCKPTEPSAPSCSYAVIPTSQHFPYQGGAGNVVVTTQSGCQWTAASNVEWVGLTSVGVSNVTYTVQANPGAARIGTLSVANQTVTITQDPAPPTSGPTPRPRPTPTPPAPQPTPTPTPIPSCTYAVQESPQPFTYQGGNGGFSVSASQSGCAWTAISNVGWIAITGGSSGSGSGSVSYLVAGNGGAARTGTISVAGKTVTVVQSAQ